MGDTMSRHILKGWIDIPNPDHTTSDQIEVVVEYYSHLELLAVYSVSGDRQLPDKHHGFDGRTICLYLAEKGPNQAGTDWRLALQDEVYDALKKEGWRTL